MKIFYLVIGMLCSVISAKAQLEISLNDGSGFTSEENIKIKFSVTNLYPVDTFFHWAIETLPEEPTDWSISFFYDVIICYPQGLTSSKCGADYRNYIEANATYPFLQFGILTEDLFEEGCITLHLLSDCVEVDHDTLLSHTFKFNSEWPTKVDEVEISSDIQIYPNPATDQLNLTNDGMVSMMRIYDAHGRLVDEKEHFAGQAQDVSHLESGSYFIELKDAAGEILGVVSFVKVE